VNAECGHRNFDPTSHNEVDIAEFLDGDTNFARFYRRLIRISQWRTGAHGEHENPMGEHGERTGEEAHGRGSARERERMGEGAHGLIRSAHRAPTRAGKRCERCGNNCKGGINCRGAMSGANKPVRRHGPPCPPCPRAPSWTAMPPPCPPVPPCAAMPPVPPRAPVRRHAPRAPVRRHGPSWTAMDRRVPPCALLP
jgi:hypothetical protein